MRIVKIELYWMRTGIKDRTRHILIHLIFKISANGITISTLITIMDEIKIKQLDNFKFWNAPADPVLFDDFIIYNSMSEMLRTNSKWPNLSFKISETNGTSKMICSTKLPNNILEFSCQFSIFLHGPIRIDMFDIEKILILNRPANIVKWTEKRCSRQSHVNVAVTLPTI